MSEVAITPSETIRLWIKYRTAELEYENEHLTNSPIGGGIVARGERQKVISVMLDELRRFAMWLDANVTAFVPPLTEDQRKEWRFARDHGATVPPHILAQL